MQLWLLDQFSKNSVERWNTDHKRNRPTAAEIRFWMRIQELFNGIISTLVPHSYSPDGWVVFDDFNLRAQLPAITCFG